MHTNSLAVPARARRGVIVAGLVGALALAGAGLAALGAAALSTHRPSAALGPEAVLGSWSGTLTGDPQLPPEGEPFTMVLTLDSEGAITGTFTAGEYVLDVKEAKFSEEDGSFTCQLVTWIENEEVKADLDGVVDGGDMDGTVTADDFAADFTASKDKDALRIHRR